MKEFVIILMTLPWVESLKQQITSGVFDPFNTKEDYEVLKGLTIGTAAWEEDFDFHISKLMRIVATIG
jgi:hypothetical protein